VHELTKMLVQAGQLVRERPEIAAEIAVGFLDPNKDLGLKAPLLKNVLTEPLGIKTDDLFPVPADLDRIQRYMHDQMGVGSLIDLGKFVDLRFAKEASADRETDGAASVLHDTDGKAMEIVTRGKAEAEDEAAKTMLDRVGKYLTFSLGGQEFGIDILKVREMIQMVPIRDVPRTPSHVKGVVSLRGEVIPVIDLGLKLGRDDVDYGNESCMIVLEIDGKVGATRTAIAVDSVSEVANVTLDDLEETPFLCGGETDYILGMAKSGEKVKILIDVDSLLGDDVVMAA